MVFEGDFVVSEITGNSSNYAPGTTGSGGAACTADASKTPCYNFFSFPAPAADSANNTAIQGAGDVAMLLNQTAQSTALIKYLAGPEAATIWATSADSRARTTRSRPAHIRTRSPQADAQALVGATSFVFSLDDLQGSWEPKMWADLIQFLKNPTPVRTSRRSRRRWNHRRRPRSVTNRSVAHTRPVRLRTASRAGCRAHQATVV